MKTNELVPVTVQLSEDIKVSVQQILDQWTAEGTVAKVWQKDASVWTSKDESKWLDWLNLPAEQLAKAAEYQAFAKEIKEAGFTTVALLGMGGSSLAPEVFSVTYGAQNGIPNCMYWTPLTRSKSQRWMPSWTSKKLSLWSPVSLAAH